MTLQPPRRKSERRLVRLSKHSYIESSTACNSFPDPSQCFAETALTEAGEMVGGCPEEVRVREVEWWLGVLEVAVVW